MCHKKKAKRLVEMIRFQDSQSRSSSVPQRRGQHPKKQAGSTPNRFSLMRRHQQSNKQNNVQLNRLNPAHLKSCRRENTGVCVQSDRNTEQHLGEYLRRGLLKSPPASRHCRRRPECPSLSPEQKHWIAVHTLFTTFSREKKGKK